MTGLIKQYDTDRGKVSELDSMMNGGSTTNLMRKSTPNFAANRHDVNSYGRIVQHEWEKRQFQPWQSTSYYAPKNTENSKLLQFDILVLRYLNLILVYLSHCKVVN